MANDFLPFANSVGANVLTQSAYAALTQRPGGFVAGTARSIELNKVWRQSSLIAAVIGQFISNRSGQSAVDDGTTVDLLANLELAIGAIIQNSAGGYAAGGGTANAQTAAFNPPITALTDGMVLKYKASVANTGAATFNPNGLGTKAIVGSAHQPLVAGEIGVGSEVWLQYNAALGSGSWVLIESSGTGGTPATTTNKGLAQLATSVQMAAGTDPSLVPSVLAVMSLFPKRTFAASDYIRIPDVVGGLLIQFGAATVQPSGDANVNFPITHTVNPRIIIGMSGQNTDIAYLATGFTQSGFNMPFYKTNGAKSTGGYNMNWISVGN